MVERDDMSRSVLLIRGEKGNHTATFVSTMVAGGQDPAGSAPALVFTHDENQYQLSSVWDSDGEGWSIIRR